ncbi:MAG TPA: hypothetical protein VGI81_01700 [Tepidisphaeraceae bacterium]|jgi:hypothetical protein
MQETGRSTLASKTSILVGSGFGKSPANATGSVNVAVYRTDDQWVICVAELSGCGEVEAESQRKSLGAAVPGRLFAAYAARGIGGDISYAEVRELIDRSVPESFPRMTIRWLDEAKLTAGAKP